MSSVSQKNEPSFGVFLPGRGMFASILAVGIAALLLIGIPPARADSLDRQPQGAAEATKQVAVAEPEAAAGTSSPPGNSLDPASDLAAFLNPGVSIDLARAALRRGWISDPAIRDFVGLSGDLPEPGR